MPTSHSRIAGTFAKQYLHHNINAVPYIIRTIGPLSSSPSFLVERIRLVQEMKIDPWSTHTNQIQSILPRQLTPFLLVRVARHIFYNSDPLRFNPIDGIIDVLVTTLQSILSEQPEQLIFFSSAKADASDRIFIACNASCTTESSSSTIQVGHKHRWIGTFP